MTVVRGFPLPAYFRTFIHFLLLPIVPERGSCWFVCVFSANRECSHQNSRTFRCSKMFHQSHFLFILFFIFAGLARFCFCFHACLIWPRTNQRFIDKILVSWFEYFTSESFQHAFSNRFWCGFPGTNFQRSDALFGWQSGVVGCGAKKNGGGWKGPPRQDTPYILWPPTLLEHEALCRRFRLWLFPAWFWVIPGRTVRKSFALCEMAKVKLSHKLRLFFTMFDGSLWQ